MKTFFPSLLAIALVAGMTTGCSQKDKGTVIGAGIGAASGYAISGGKAGGAAIGGVAGGLIGRSVAN